MEGEWALLWTGYARAYIYTTKLSLDLFSEIPAAKNWVVCPGKKKYTEFLWVINTDSETGRDFKAIVLCRYNWGSWNSGDKYSLCLKPSHSKSSLSKILK
jgi:hypothetical protein